MYLPGIEAHAKIHFRAAAMRHRPAVLQHDWRARRAYAAYAVRPSSWRTCDYHWLASRGHGGRSDYVFVAERKASRPFWFAMADGVRDRWQRMRLAVAVFYSQPCRNHYCWIAKWAYHDL